MRAPSNVSLIRQLHPQKDCHRIVQLFHCVEFPEEHALAAKVAFFRSFASAKVAEMMIAGGAIVADFDRRVERTDVLLTTAIENGYDSELGRRAIARIIERHSSLPIENVDYLYVLSTLVFEPLRWIERYGWRQPEQNERLAWFHTWVGIGRGMGIRDLPTDLDEFERFNRSYEEQFFVTTESSIRLGAAVQKGLREKYPGRLGTVRTNILLSLLDPKVLDVLRIPRPPEVYRRASAALLFVRAAVNRRNRPRAEPVYRSKKPRKNYPNGYAF